MVADFWGVTFKFVEGKNNQIADFLSRDFKSGSIDENIVYNKILKSSDNPKKFLEPLTMIQNNLISNSINKLGKIKTSTLLQINEFDYKKMNKIILSDKNEIKMITEEIHIILGHSGINSTDNTIKSLYKIENLIL